MILDDIVARTRVDLPARKARTSMAALEAGIAARPPVESLWRSLRSQPGAIAAIAEFKRRSPSAGWIREGAEVASVVPRYVAAGAAALSILTDGPFFGGSLLDLERARESLPARASAAASDPPSLADGRAPRRPPILRKDFIVDAFQIVEARAAGADAVLLIVAALTEAELRGLLAECARSGLEALVEAHSAAEAERAVAAGASLVGVNHRDLRDFTMDMELAIRLRPRIPAACVMVAESGIRTAADVARLAAAGIDAILVGESLMRAEDPGAALRALLAGPSSADGRS